MWQERPLPERLQGEVWPPGTPQPEVARVDEIKALLDAGCTKTLTHPQYIDKEDYLGWDIPSTKQIYFPAASVELEVEGRVMKISVGVSEHTGQDMLMGRDISKMF